MATKKIELSAIEGELWQAFCERLADAKSTLVQTDAPTTRFDQAEGSRYLSRLIRLGLEIYLESGDPDFPEFYKPSHETAKMGGDNPDNLYLSSTISGNHTYRLTGNIGTVAYLSIGSKANRYAIDGTMPSTGELIGEDISVDDNGEFDIIVSAEKPRDQLVSWLPIAQDSSMLHIRQTFLDRRNEIPATVDIERISDGPDVPPPISSELISSRMMDAADFVVNTSKLFAGWASKFKSRPNELLDWGQDMFIKAGGDPEIFYVHGYWQLQPHEALVIETLIPECDHWNIQVNNWWMESLDYRYHDIWVNKKSVQLNADGSATIVISERNTGFGNWLPTAGHERGFALLRWVRANHHPVPTSKVINLNETLTVN